VIFLPFRFSNQKFCMHLSSLPCVLRDPSHSPWFDRRKIPMRKASLINQFSNEHQTGWITFPLHSTYFESFSLSDSNSRSPNVATERSCCMYYFPLRSTSPTTLLYMHSSSLRHFRGRLIWLSAINCSCISTKHLTYSYTLLRLTYFLYRVVMISKINSLL
jgi:hypothetical protein